jgi:hypothetical protein
MHKLISIILLSSLASSAMAFSRDGGGGFHEDRSMDDNRQDYDYNRDDYSVEQSQKVVAPNQVDNTTTINNKQNGNSYNVNNSNTYHQNYKTNNTTITNNNTGKSYTVNNASNYGNSEQVTKVTNNQTGQSNYVINGTNTQHTNQTQSTTTYVNEPYYYGAGYYPVNTMYVGMPMGSYYPNNPTIVNNYYNGENPAELNRNESQPPLPSSNSN